MPGLPQAEHTGEEGTPRMCNCICLRLMLMYGGRRGPSEGLAVYKDDPVSGKETKQALWQNE